MRVIAAFVIACAIALPAHAQQQQQIAAPTLFSIRGGETLLLRSKDITDQKDVNLTLRVRVKTKQTSGATATMRYHLLLFPAPSGATEEPAKQ
jgi:hypothetical protein